MKDGFIRAGAACPTVKIGNAAENAKTLIRAAGDAAALGVQVLVFPELCLTSASAGDLFFSPFLLCEAESALATYIRETSSLDMLSFVGLPVACGGKIFNCTAAVEGGRLLGLVPKTMLSRDEKRFFSPAPDTGVALSFAGQETVLDTNLIFACEEMPEMRVACEFGTELQAPVPPSCAHAAAGATLIVCPSATPEKVCRAAFRRRLTEVQSARTLTSYILAEAGSGESGTDGVYGGQLLLAENGTVREEALPFEGKTLIYTEFDLARSLTERAKSDVFEADFDADYTTVNFGLSLTRTTFSTPPSKTPFLPADPTERSERMELMLDIQSEGLACRAVRAYAKTLVMGISGGLDSTLALLVACRALDRLGRDRSMITAVTMPCFGTTARTKGNAERLCEELGVTLRTVDIHEAVRVHFRDIGHDESVTDTTYENAQARERTQILMDISNAEGGMVVGTGDLSELALGWATYNGDHMSMYGVNGGVPKTLVRHLVAHEATLFEERGMTGAAAVLRDILATPVSPELLPPTDEGEIAQETEGIVGPYELHDFFLYYFVRYSYSPSKILRLAVSAFEDVYEEPEKEILPYLHIFVRRFFTQQFKRSCLPDGPAVGSVALSPRTAFRMPSDFSPEAFLCDLPPLPKK